MSLMTDLHKIINAHIDLSNKLKVPITISLDKTFIHIQTTIYPKESFNFEPLTKMVLAIGSTIYARRIYNLKALCVEVYNIFNIETDYTDISSKELQQAWTSLQDSFPNEAIQYIDHISRTAYAGRRS